MSTSSTRTRSPQTELRTLRTFLDDLMAGPDVPPAPICARIRELREQRFEADKDVARSERRKNKFSQEEIAHRVGVTLKAYRAFEEFREPDYGRRRAIAAALELPEEFFESQVSQSQEIRDLRGEVAELHEMVAELLRRTA